MKNPYKTKIRAGSKEVIPNKIQDGKMFIELWQTIPEGFQNEVTGEVLSADEFEVHKLNQMDGDNSTLYSIKPME